VEEEKRLQRIQGGKTMKVEEQKFHNLNPWPYNLPLNLAFVRRVLRSCFKVTPYVTRQEGVIATHQI
jgi:hypothetical protein